MGLEFKIHTKFNKDITYLHRKICIVHVWTKEY